MKPAVKIIFAPLFKRDKAVRDTGAYLHGKAEGRTIWIDPRSGTTIIDTLLHELTHVRHPDWSEALVRSYTAARMKKMSWKEKARLLQLFGRAQLEGE